MAKIWRKFILAPKCELFGRVIFVIFPEGWIGCRRHIYIRLPNFVRIGWQL